MKEDAISRLVSELLAQDSRDITRELYRRALRQSCDFIEQNMLLVNSSFKNRFELLDFSIKSTTVQNGLWLEFGVYTGSTILYIADRIESLIYGFDSFQGNPDDWRSDHRKGEFALSKIPDFPPKVKIVKGWFEESLPRFVKEHKEPISFIHIDCDLYSSTRTVLYTLRDRLSSGSIIVFDEFFNYPGWQNHEFRAFMEFANSTDLKYEYIGYVCNHSQVAVRVQ